MMRGQADGSEEIPWKSRKEHTVHLLGKDVKYYV
jgi:hypothetical protein